jgi:hypothetical protein
VRERLIVLFRALPDTPTYSPAPNVFEEAGERVPIDGLELLAATSAFPGAALAAAIALLTCCRLPRHALLGPGRVRGSRPSRGWRPP